MYPTLFVLGMLGYNKLETRRDLALALYVVRVLRGNITSPGILGGCLCVPDVYVHVNGRVCPRCIVAGPTDAQPGSG